MKIYTSSARPDLRFAHCASLRTNGNPMSNVKILFVWCVRNDRGIFQSADLCGASRNGIFINAIVQQQEVVHEKNAPRTNLKWLPFVIWDVGERALYVLNSNPSLYMPWRRSRAMSTAKQNPSAGKIYF